MIVPPARATLFPYATLFRSDLAASGAVVTKSVQLRARSVRPTPRMAETPSGMLNSIGLQGPGIDGLLAEDLPWLAEHGARALVSIAGTRVEDFEIGRAHV